MKYCEHFAALLDPFVDSELSPDEMSRVQAHLDECPACRAYVDDALAIRAAFPDAEDAEVPEGFAEGVMARIRTKATSQAETVSRAEASSKRKTFRPWLKALVSLAACCAIVLLAAPMFAHGSKTEAAPAEAPAAAADTGASAERVMGFAYTAEKATAEESAEEAREDLASSKLYDAAPAPSAAAGSDAKAHFKSDTSSWLTLTAEEAGSLLASFTPVEETETELRYELTSGELETLLAALSEAGIVPSGELHPTEMEDTYVLVIVTK